MERDIFGKEGLVVPTEFTSPRFIQENLVPPSHFASTVQSNEAQKGALSKPWIQPPASGTPTLPGDATPANPWLALSQAQREILELKKENQRILMLQRSDRKGKIFVEQRCKERSEEWSRWDLDWHLEVEKHKAEAERLKGQTEVLKGTAERYREEIRDKDITVNRQSHALHEIREQLSKAKAELSHIRKELCLSNVQREEMSLKLKKLKAEADEETIKLRKDLESCREESRELAHKAEKCKLQAEEEAKQQTLTLLGQLDAMKRKQEVEIQQMNASHYAELTAAKEVKSELQDRLQSMTSEFLHLESALKEALAERDGLKEHLSQMGHAFETQSATLHSLRTYIGQLAPDKEEKERLNEAVERLNKEKSALQMTTEHLTTRLNCVNDILSLQEEKIAKSASTDPLIKNVPDSLQVLQLWRAKVFQLCVQLRSKDIEMRREKNLLLSQARSMEQQLQQEQHRVNILQHSLHDKTAELDIEKVEKESKDQNLVKVQNENEELKIQHQKIETDFKMVTEALQRFSHIFESKVGEVEAAKNRLTFCIQRLSFAKRRVETIQGLFMRKRALQKIEEASKQKENENERILNLKKEHSLVCEERDKLVQELKRTPEFIERALADLKEQYETKAKQQQLELEHSCMEVRLAVDAKEKAEQSVQELRAQLEDRDVSLESLRCELLRQQQQNERALHERVCEVEERCAEKLRAMEVQVSAARREHTKAERLRSVLDELHTLSAAVVTSPEESAEEDGPMNATDELNG